MNYQWQDRMTDIKESKQELIETIIHEYSNKTKMSKEEILTT